MTPASTFDTCPPRRGTGSFKWDLFDEDCLPMWVADMDFRSPEPVIQALKERVEHGVFGYTMEPKDLKSVLVERMQKLYHWTITEEDIQIVPGVVLGFNLAIQGINQPGEGVLIQPPVYGPFMKSADYAGCDLQEAPLGYGPDHKHVIDFDGFRDAIQPNHTRSFLLCNPHNPGGRVWRKDELQHMADICIENDMYIISDEIHCDLIFSGHQHTPMAALSDEVAQRTVTLMAPSKTFNIAGLGASFMIVQNPALRERIEAAKKGIIAHLDLLAYTAMRACYTQGQEWLDELLVVLEGNRDLVTEFVNHELPGCSVAECEGTYLAWINCRESKCWIPREEDKDAGDFDDALMRFFRDEAKVIFNPGSFFGTGGDGFVRFNFGCPRSQVEEALKRMKAALVQ
jgi:cystathionine beta-lyase